MKHSYPLTAEDISFAENGDPEIIPSATSNSADYDFLLGRHTVIHKKLKHRLQNSDEWLELQGEKATQPILAGIGNIEEHTLYSANSTPLKAIALRLFNPATKLWSLYWADSVTGVLDPPLQGSFYCEVGVFFGKDKWNGEDIWVQFQYDRTDPDNPVWGQAFSRDGKTWEWNWFMYFRKQKK